MLHPKRTCVWQVAWTPWGKSLPGREKLTSKFITEHLRLGPIPAPSPPYQTEPLILALPGSPFSPRGPSLPSRPSRPGRPFSAGLHMTRVQALGTDLCESVFTSAPSLPGSRTSRTSMDRRCSMACRDEKVKRCDHDSRMWVR